MKKIVLIGILSMIAMADGEKIFYQKCKSCHILQKGRDLTQSQRLKMVAPPAFGIVKHVKERFGNKKDFINFVASYIKHPDITQSQCKKEVIKRFGLMPPVGASMTKKERESVANWLFENL